MVGLLDCVPRKGLPSGGRCSSDNTFGGFEALSLQVWVEEY